MAKIVISFGFPNSFEGMTPPKLIEDPKPLCYNEPISNDCISFSRFRFNLINIFGGDFFSFEQYFFPNKGAANLCLVTHPSLDLWTLL